MFNWKKQKTFCKKKSKTQLGFYFEGDWSQEMRCVHLADSEAIRSVFYSETSSNVVLVQSSEPTANEWFPGCQGAEPVLASVKCKNVLNKVTLT